MTQTTERKLKKWVIPAGVGLILMLGVAGYFYGKKGTKGEDHARATTLDGHPIPHTNSDAAAPSSDPNRKPASEPEEYEPDHAEEEIEVQIAHQDHKKPSKHDAAHEDKSQSEESHGVAGKIFGFFKGIHEKVVAIQNAEDESRRLRLENAHLRVMLETSRYACLSDEAKRQTEKVGAKLNAETGTKIGRTLAAIPYQIPENMMPDALYTLGVSYFKARDSEKAVAILSFLADMQGDDTYKTPTNYLMTGISWFRLDNYKYADEYFSRVIDMKPTKENRAYKVQAKVWKALVAQRMKDPSAAQAWLKRTLESHPQTKEARWINPQEGDRMPASHSEDEKASAHHHDDAKKQSHH